MAETAPPNPPPPRKRPFFQVHLSTAVVLMFAAGGLVWANLRTYPAEIIIMIRADEWDIDAKGSGPFDARGWPLGYIAYDRRPAAYEPWMRGAVEHSHAGRVHFSAVLINSSVALALLFMVALALELLIRRRERKL